MQTFEESKYAQLPEVLDKSILMSKPVTDGSDHSFNYFFNLPLESKKNSKYFHKMPTVTDWQKIVNSGTVDLLPNNLDYQANLDNFRSKLAKCRVNIEKYK